jgi:hypothetical protein
MVHQDLLERTRSTVEHVAPPKANSPEHCSKGAFREKESLCIVKKRKEEERKLISTVKV